MGKTVQALAIPYSRDWASESSDWIGLGLFALALCLLPLERLVLPYGLRVADFALMLLTLYGLITAWHKRQKLVFPLILPMWLILLSSLMATLVGFVHFDSIVAIIQEIYLFTWFIVLTNLLRRFPLSDMDWLLKVWALVACIEVATTLMGMARIGPSMFYTLPYRDRTITSDIVRAVGTFINPNATAVYLCVSFFVLMATSWSAWFRALLGTWMLAGMFATGSNGALIATFGGLAVLVGAYSITENPRKIMAWGAIAGIGAGLAVAILFALGSSASLFSSIDLHERQRLLFLTLGRFSHSLNGRIDLIEWASQIYIQHPFGTGPNSFSTLQASLHNDYIAFLFERGPVGLIGWVWMVVAAWIMPFRVATRRISAQQRWTVLALGAGFLACALNAFAHEVSHMRQVWMLMVFLFALSYAFLAQRDRSFPQPVRTG